MVKADKRARAKITPERQGELLVNRKQAETESHRYRGTPFCEFPGLYPGFFIFTMNPTILSEELCITRCLQT